MASSRPAPPRPARRLGDATPAAARRQAVFDHISDLVAAVEVVPAAVAGVEGRDRVLVAVVVGLNRVFPVGVSARRRRAPDAGSAAGPEDLPRLGAGDPFPDPFHIGVAAGHPGVGQEASRGELEIGDKGVLVRRGDGGEIAFIAGDRRRVGGRVQGGAEGEADRHELIVVPVRGPECRGRARGAGHQPSRGQAGQGAPTKNPKVHHQSPTLRMFQLSVVSGS